MQTYELCSDMIDIAIDISCIYGMKEDEGGIAYDVNSHAIVRLNNGMVLYLHEVNKYLALVALVHGKNFSKHGLCFIFIFISIFLYIYVSSFDEDKSSMVFNFSPIFHSFFFFFFFSGLIEYNVGCFKKAMAEIFNISSRT